jgi:hypothetical protein
MRRRGTYADVARLENCEDGQPGALADTRPSRAVSRNRNIGIPSLSGVRQDQFDHQVEFIGAVDHTRYTVRLIRRDELGFGEAIQTTKALGIVELRQERHARPTLRPRELDHLAQTSIVAPALSSTKWNLESRVEYLPRLRPGCRYRGSAKPAKLRVFYPGTDNGRPSAAIAEGRPSRNARFAGLSRTPAGGL